MTATPRTTDRRRAIARELALTWGFVRYDASSTIVPGSLAVLAASRWHERVDLCSLLLGALYFVLYIYTFAVSNQIIGLEEDRRNKPDRPLPAGLVSVSGAWWRWAFAMVLFPLLGAALGVARFALLWQLCFCLYNHAGFARHWATKSLVMGLGVIAQLGAAWAMVGPVPAIAWRWILGLAVVAYIFCNLQDLRDVDGDRALRRKTLPILYGLPRACLGLAALYAVGLPAITYFWLFAPLPSSALGLGFQVVLGAVSLTIAARLVLDQRPRALHYTYLMCTGWYCLALLSASFVLPGAA